jgi:threonine/homoserine/homoserine lactone efflux protein
VVDTSNLILDILNILFGGFCVGLASSVTVGPVAVLCIQRTLSKGHLSGLLSGMGIACADTIMAILAFSVYALLKSYIDEYNTLIQLCGGVFVVIVGIFIFFKNPVPQIRKNRAGESALWQDFGSMFGFTLANFVVVIPYILAFFTMFNIDLVMDIEGDGVAAAANISPWAHNCLVLGGFFLGATLWWGALTSIISFFHRGFRPRHMLTINRIAGIVIMVLGLVTLISVILD